MDMTQSKLQAGAPDTSAIGLLQTALAGLYTPRRLAIVMLIQALLLLGHVIDSWHASPDSALYLGLARSITEGNGYTFNHKPYEYPPPLYSLFLAGQSTVLGQSFVAMNACQAALALACTPMAFWLLRRLYGPDLGFLGAGLFGLNFCLWRTASMMLSDILFILLGTLAMLAALWAARSGARRWLAVTVTGALIGLGSLAQVNALMIVPGAAVALSWGWPMRSRAARIAVLVVLIALSVAPLLA